MSIEEMYDELRKETQRDKNQAEETVVLGALQDEQTFVDINGVVYGV